MTLFFALFVAFLSLLAGCLAGGREAYHADVKIFEKVFNAKPTSFWGSYSWLRKYKGMDSDNKEMEYYTWVSDFWHVSAWGFDALLITACLTGCYFLPFHILLIGISIYIIKIIAKRTSYNLLRYGKMI